MNLNIVESKQALNVYISNTGYICLHQENYPDEDVTIAINPEDVEKVINGLQQLLEKRRSLPEASFLKQN